MSENNLETLIENAGYTARSYSGRGMYGKQCIGVTVSDIFNFLAELVQEARNQDEDCLDYVLTEVIPYTSSDSMGYDTILYWTSIEYTGIYDEESEENEEN